MILQKCEKHQLEIEYKVHLYFAAESGESMCSSATADIAVFQMSDLDLSS